MPRRIRLMPYVAVDELEMSDAPEQPRSPYERSRWQILLFLAKGRTAPEIAKNTGYSRYCTGQLARRYNEQRPSFLLSAAHLEELAAALRDPVPEGDD